MSRLLQLVLAIGLGFLYTSRATAGDDDAKAKGKGKKGAVPGVVQSVDKDTITVKVHQRKKGSGSGSPEEKTFKIGTSTTVELVSKGDNGLEKKDAKVDDLKAGQRVRITLDGDTAKEIDILGTGKKKKNQND